MEIYQPASGFPHTADEAIRQFRDLFERSDELRRARGLAGLLLIEKEFAELRRTIEDLRGQMTGTNE